MGCRSDSRPGEDEALPGAYKLLRQADLPVVVVTSATRAVALHRLARAKLPAPQQLVAADDVRQGKPHPEPYVTAAHRIGLLAADCVAIEDSPLGVQAALAVGATTVAVLVSHPRDEFDSVRHFIPNLASLKVEQGGTCLTAPRGRGAQGIGS